MKSITKNTTIKRMIFSLFTGFAVLSCKDASFLIEQTSTTPQETLNESGKEKLMNAFASSLAQAMSSSVELRNFLKAEMLNQFDDEYEALFFLLKDKKVTAEKTFADFINDYSDEKLQQSLSKFPTLTIKFPAIGDNLPEMWDTMKETPIVSVRSFKDSPDINAYDNLGSPVTMSKLKAPDKLTFIIEQSERITIEDPQNIQQDIQKSIEKWGGSLKSARLADGRPSSFSSWWMQPCPRSSSQAAGLRSWITEINIAQNVWGWAEDNWQEGQLDIVAKLLTLRGDSKTFEELNVGALIPRRTARYDSRTGIYRYFDNFDAWIPFGSSPPALREWDVTLQGDTWKIIFMEADPGDQTYEVTDSISSNFEFGIKTTDGSKNVIGFNAGYKGAETGTKKLTYKNADDLLGEAYIKYCDKLGEYQTYSTGKMMFRIGVY